MTGTRKVVPATDYAMEGLFCFLEINKSSPVSFFGFLQVLQKRSKQAGFSDFPSIGSLRYTTPFDILEGFVAYLDKLICVVP